MPSTWNSSRFILSPPDLGDRVLGRDRLGVDAELDDRGRPAPSARSRAPAKSSVRSTVSPWAPNASRGGEVRVDEVGADHPARIEPLLVHPDRPQHAVVHDEDDDRELVLDGRRELLAGHQEVAVARDADSGTVRKTALAAIAGTP